MFNPDPPKGSIFSRLFRREKPIPHGMPTHSLPQRPAIFDSPFVTDTLQSISGSIYKNPTIFKRLGVSLSPEEDFIAMARPANSYPIRSFPEVYVTEGFFDLDRLKQKGAQDQRWVLAHEIGHFLEDEAIYELLENKGTAKVRLAKQFLSKSGKPEDDPYTKLSGIAGQGYGQHFAEAFANSIMALDDIRIDPKNAKDIIASRDKKIPGTAKMIEYMLDNFSIYSNHPLKTKKPRAGTK